MNILLLEDNAQKREKIKETVHKIVPDANINEVMNWNDYTRQICTTKFDLILLDLMVPRSARDSRVEDQHVLLVETTRNFESMSFLTPAIVLTEYLKESEEYFHDLNKVNISLISLVRQ